MYCPDSDKLTVQGQFYDYEFTYIDISIKECLPSDGVECHAPSELNGKTVSFAHTETFVHLDEGENTIENGVELKVEHAVPYIVLDPKFEKKYILDVGKGEVCIKSPFRIFDSDCYDIS